MMVAVAPRRMFSSLSALLSTRLNWMFSLRRLSPAAVSVLPRRLSSRRRVLVSGAGGGVSGFGCRCCWARAALRQRMATSGVRIVSIMAIKKAADAPFGRLRL